MSFFFTQNELTALFVQAADYIDPIEFSAVDSVAAVDGIQLVKGQTTGGGFTLTLESPTTAAERWQPIFVNIGSNTLTIDPGAATINGIAGTQDIVSQWGSLELKHDGTNFRTPDYVTPS
jgi:hypothetical protein